MKNLKVMTIPSDTKFYKYYKTGALSFLASSAVRVDGTGHKLKESINIVFPYDLFTINLLGKYIEYESLYPNVKNKIPDYMLFDTRYTFGENDILLYPYIKFKDGQYNNFYLYQVHKCRTIVPDINMLKFNWNWNPAWGYDD